MTNLVGSKPNQLPTIGELGTLAFQNTGSVDSINATNLTVAKIDSSSPLTNTTPYINVDFVNSESWFHPNAFVSSSPATYVGKDGYLKTSAANEMRIEYDPLTGECLGLLLERASTNVLTYSEQLSAWISVNATTVEATNVKAPDNETTADYLQTNSTPSIGHYVRQAFTATTDEYYTGSIFVKPNGVRSIQLVFSGYSTWQGYSEGHTPEVHFNLDTKTYTKLNPYFSASIKEYKDGWFRCSITGKRIGATGNSYLNVMLSTSDTPVVKEDYGTGLTNVDVTGNPGVYLWGGQVEQSNALTSYIKTISSIVSRDADTYKFSTIGLDWKWSFVVDYSLPYVTNKNSLFDDTIFRDVISLYNMMQSQIISAYQIRRIPFQQLGVNVDETTIDSLVAIGNIIQATDDYIENTRYTPEVDKRYRVVGALSEPSSMSICDSSMSRVYLDSDYMNGLIISSSAFVEIRLGVGSDANNMLNGHIKKFQLYQTKLSETDLLEIIK